MAWSAEQPFQALALTGGGYRGLFTARVLQELEDYIGEPIGRRFDLTYGTSIGGIVALAVAFEVPMKKVVETFVEHGTKIFPLHDKPTAGWRVGADILAHRRSPRYESANLREVVLKLLPEDLTLNEAKHACAIPAVNVTKGEPQVFKTRHKAEWTRDWKFKAVDVAMATAAAPTFFGLAEVGGNRYADGGLFANAPDLLAMHEAENYFNVPPEAVRILSVGTTTKKYSLSYGTGTELGVFDWMSDQRLFNVIISSQQQLVDQLMKHKLGNRYVRIDAEPSNEQASDLGLDVASEAARNTLIGLATKCASDLIGNILQPYLKHTPQMTLVRGG